MQPELDVFIIDTPETFNELKRLVKQSSFEIVSLDLETDSVNEKKANIYGIGLSFEKSTGYYIPIRKRDTSRWWLRDHELSIYSWVRDLCRSHKLIGWNLVYDSLVFEYNSGFDISQDIYADVMLMKHTIDEERPFALKECAVKYLGPWADKAKKALLDNITLNGGKTTQNEMEMHKADTDILGEYCGWDVLLTRLLFDMFEPRLKEEGLADLFYKEEIMPLYREVTIDMKRRGFTIDVDYFNNLKIEIAKEITNLQAEIMDDLSTHIKPYQDGLLDKNYPAKRSGNFPKIYAELYGFPLPIKDGKVTLGNKALKMLTEDLSPMPSYYAWLMGDDASAPPLERIRETQEAWFRQDNPEQKYVFNLKSNDHLGWLFFEHFQEKPLSKTEKGKPQCDDDYLESVKEKYPFVAKLIDFKKLNKLSSTYIEGILESATDGVIYCSFLQHGTTSGRYSATNPNLQNLPATKKEDDDHGLSPIVLKYVNSIKRGFIAPTGSKIINADYSSLEPVCFAHVSGDEKLRDVFRKGYDLYSAIAIEVFGIEGCSANKKDPNYLKYKYPELRQKAKVIALAVVYGAEANRISQVADIDYKSADDIIHSYLDAYPNLKKYMQRCEYEAKKQGFVKSQFGRMRHLPNAKSLYASYGDKLMNKAYVNANGLKDIRYTFKNSLNNAKNFPIQCLAAHIVNRALIKASRLFREYKIEGGIVAMVHDEICCVARADQAELCKKLLREAMENTTKISVALQAEPKIADNWSDAK
jgi:DNA polymerase I-like protein with 3'-5' exonuclease and polymerase domains